MQQARAWLLICGWTVMAAAFIAAAVDQYIMPARTLLPAGLFLGAVIVFGFSNYLSWKIWRER